MDISKQHLIDDIKYFEDEENMQLHLRDGCEKYSDDYNYHQKAFGTYCRARIRAENELKQTSKGESIGFG